MQVEALSLTNFRNFESQTCAFGPGINVLYGNNGAGKTNLLEAVFTLCLGRSQRAAKDILLVREGAEHYRIHGKVAVDKSHFELAVAYQSGGRKKISIDSAPVKASELYERMSLVAAGPEDSDILAGPPSARRLFLDLYLSQMHQTYLADLSDYQKALTQRNAALKNEMDPSPFDPLVVSFGAKIMRARARFLNVLGTKASEIYSDIADGETLELQYKPKVAPDEPDDLTSIEASFSDALHRNRERDRIMQTSLVGPHRDEIDFQIAGLPARTHGSQGQWRSAAISLKLAIYEQLKEKRGGPPILLLDEIFAEVDNGRAERLILRFFESGQLFLTTAVDPPESLMEGARRFRVAAGQIVEAE
jgi:DNA replication and repair protein RecF